MARFGLNFGTAFQRLDDIRSDSVFQDATSEVLANETDGNDYHLHQTVIYASLQHLTVAASATSKGYATPITRILVPTKIEEICVYRCHKIV